MKIRIFVLWFAAATVALAQQVTPNIGLLIQTPPQYANNWGAITNYNFQKIDTAFAGVGSQWRGAWSSVTAYTAGNFVSYLGNYYLAIQNSTNQNPVTQTAYWVGVNGSGGCTGVTPGSYTNTNLTVNSAGCVTAASNGSGGSGGVQFNPTTTNYIFLSFSGLYDDTHALSSAVPVTSASCVGASAPYTCTVVTTSAHNLSVGNYVDVATITGWLSSGVVTPFNGSFQIISAGFTTTQFEFLSSLGTFSCASSCGNVYDASYWAIYQTANQPFLKGHGTVYGVESDVASADTNFSTVLAPLCSLSPGPNYLIIEAGQNDLNAGANYATIIGHLAGTGANTGIWYKAHAAGCTILQGSIVPGSYGSGLNGGLIATNMELNEQLPTFVKSFANLASGQYFDRFIDYNSYMMYTTADGALGNLGTVSWQAHQFAQRTNMAFADQQDSTVGPFPFLGMGGAPGSGGYTWDLAGASWNFINTLGDSSGKQWMGWNGGDLYLYYQNQAGGAPLLNLFTPFLGNSTDFCNSAFGHDSGSVNAYELCFSFTSTGSNSNYFHLRPYGGSDAVRMYGDSTVSIPSVATSPSTSPICPNGTNGTLTTSGCSGGSTLDANTLSTPQYVVGGGTANAQTVTLSPSIGSLSSGMHVRWIPSNANTGAATLAVNGLTAESITKCGTTALAAGDLALLTVAEATYDGTQFQLLDPMATACAGSAPGVTSIDSQTGAFTFSGAGVSHTGNAYTFSGGSGGYSVLPAPPALAGFTNVNFQSGTTVTQSVPGNITLTVPNNGTDQIQYIEKSIGIATPWRISAYFSQNGRTNGSSDGFSNGGLYLSDGTKVVTLESFFYGGESTCTGKSPGCMRVDHWTNNTTETGNVWGGDTLNGTIFGAISSTGGYWAVCDDGTNIYYEQSWDGAAWTSLFSEAVGSFITPTEVGIGAGAGTGGSALSIVSLRGFQIASVGSCP